MTEANPITDAGLIERIAQTICENIDISFYKWGSLDIEAGRTIYKTATAIATLSSRNEEVEGLRQQIDAAVMAKTRLDDFADRANAGQVHYSARELKRKIGAAFAEFDVSPPHPEGHAQKETERLQRELAGAEAERDRMREALVKARQFVNDWGPEKPGLGAVLTNNMLAMIDAALNPGGGST